MDGRVECETYVFVVAGVGLEWGTAGFLAVEAVADRGHDWWAGYRVVYIAA